MTAHEPVDWEEVSGPLAARAIAEGRPTGWFEELYAAGTAGAATMPWSRTTPHPLLTEWTAGREGTGRTAVVVGCGLGADAEHVAGLGYDTTAFDIAETAVAVARARNRRSRVHYTTADLLALPGDWRHAFDLVVEIITVQALPEPPRRAAIAGVASLVAPGGSLFVIAARREPDDLPDARVAGPPWPLTRAEILAFADGLEVVRVDAEGEPGHPVWRAEFTRAV